MAEKKIKVVDVSNVLIDDMAAGGVVTIAGNFPDLRNALDAELVKWFAKRQKDKADELTAAEKKRTDDLKAQADAHKVKVDELEAARATKQTEHQEAMQTLRDEHKTRVDDLQAKITDHEKTIAKRETTIAALMAHDDQVIVVRKQQVADIKRIGEELVRVADEQAATESVAEAEEKKRIKQEQRRAQLKAELASMPEPV